MDLKTLSDRELLEKTIKAVAGERASLVSVLHHINEVEKRKLYAETCSSLFEWLTKDLKMSSGHAQRRIDAARLMREFPEIETKLNSGALNLMHTSMARQHFRRNKNLSKTEKAQVLKSLEGKSTSEAEKLFKSTNTKKMTLEFTEDQLKVLERVRSLWGHRLRKATWEEIIMAMAELTLEKIDPDKKASRARRTASTGSETATGKSVTAAATGQPEHRSIRPQQPPPTASTGSETRYLPASVRHQVWRRDGGRCTYVYPDGRRCESTHLLQFDHRQPYALGGPHTPENLRLLCATHNQLNAKKLFEPGNRTTPS